jgi:dinuclear metal center YbgI/SA1388 family protein
MTRVRDIVSAIDRAAPFHLQWDWDNSGLLVGDPAATVRRVLVALDPTGAVIAEARRRKAECLVTHHPLFFTKLKGLTPDTPVGATALALAEARMALVAAHTNYDAAPGGLNDVLARKLGLVETLPLLPSDRQKGYKLVTFVPVSDQSNGCHGGRRVPPCRTPGNSNDHRLTSSQCHTTPESLLERIERALFAAGAGQIGDYRECSFRIGGTGSFVGGATTHPAIGRRGRRGRREKVAEVRLETVVPAGRVDAVVAALRAAHPYEEPAFDLYPVEIPAAGPGPDFSGAGVGRSGRLKKPELVAALVARVKRALGVRTVEVISGVGRSTGARAARRVSRVALLGGGGSEYWKQALDAGAEVYLTGEMKHHDRLAAREAGLIVLVAGHYATEHVAVAGLSKILSAALPEVEVLASKDESNPTQWR